LPALYRDLIRFPLTGYREFNAAVTWGQHYSGPTHHPFPIVMQCLPILIPFVALRAWFDRTRGGLDRGVILGVFCIVALLGALYYPDYTHLAMAAPVYAVAAGDLSEWMLGRLPPAASRAAGWALGGVLLALFGAQMRETRGLRWLLYSVRAETGFGTVDFALPGEAAKIEALSALARAEPDSDFFIYPHHAAVYLMIGKRNPTRHQILLKGYTRPEQVDEVIGALESKKVRYVALLTQTRSQPIPEFSRYLATHYRRVPIGSYGARHSFLYERIDASPRGR
jgi:hypothetical protein